MPRERRVTVRVSVMWTVVVALWCAGIVSPALADNWPRFRGPNGQGISEAKGIPTKWSDQDYAWKIALPGKGHSSPVIWDGKVFVTSADEGARRGVILCLDGSDGKELWRREQDLSKYPLNSLNSYASPTPAVDAEHVYLLWPGKDETILAALTHDGREAWTKTLKGVHARHGKGSSPIVYGEHVIVAHEQEQKGEGVTSQWLGIDRRTGKVVWRFEEPPVAKSSYSTPCIYRSRQGRAQVVLATNAHGLVGVDPETGAVLWESDSGLPARVVSSPVIAGEVVLGTCGQGGRGMRLSAVRPVQDGASFSVSEVYGLEGKVVPYVPTSVAYQGRLFTFHDNGLISCLASDTGRTLWSEKPAGRFYSSPICVNGILYGVTIDGDVVVVRAQPSYELLAVNAVGGKSHATPAVADGRLYVRTFSHLVCIGDGGK